MASKKTRRFPNVGGTPEWFMFRKGFPWNFITLIFQHLVWGSHRKPRHVEVFVPDARLPLDANPSDGESTGGQAILGHLTAGTGQWNRAKREAVGLVD